MFARARVHKGLLAIFAATFCSLTGLFLFFPLLLFTLKGRGLPDAVVGLVASAEWLGFAVGTPFVALWVSRLGLRRAYVFSGLIPFLAMVGITLTPWPLVWVALILVGGVSGSMRWIVAETTVTQMAPKSQRGTIVGLFGTMISLTYIVGPAMLAWIGTEGDAAELARWTAVALSAIGVGFSLMVPAPVQSTQSATYTAPRLGLHGIVDALRAAPLLMVAGLLGGFFEAGGTGMLPLFGLAIGLGAAKSALLISASGLGGVLVQAPVGVLADHWSHRRIFLASSAVMVVASTMTFLVTQLPALAYVIAFIWGAGGGALYTLAMVDVGHRGQGVHLVNFTAVLVLSYTVGGALGPLFGGLALSSTLGTDFRL